jgi:hypothetical protein
VRVRFELPNTDDGLLRPEMYGSVDLRVPLGERLVVPATAVFDSGRHQIVFVAAAEGRLEPRDVEVGVRTDEWIEVKNGLSAGERVVTSANFLVDSESQLQGAESMMGMMGAVGMGDRQMEGAKPMSMGGAEPEPTRAPTAPASEEKRIGDLLVEIFPATENAQVGRSAIRVRVRDEHGRPVEEAKVSFAYTMDMPGMPIATTEAKRLEDGLYEGSAEFAMAGPWSVVVSVDRPGKPTLRERFVVRVGG